MASSYYLYTDLFLEVITYKKEIDTDLITALYIENVNESKLAQYNISIDTIFDSLTRFKNLAILHMTNCSLTYIPNTFYDNIKIRNLNLTGNKLTDLPNTIKNMTNLTELTLDNNLFTSITKNVCSLFRLTSLNMNDNKITSIPDCISRLTDLIILSLNDNHISEITDDIAALENLGELYLNHNRLTDLPENIIFLHSLYEVGLDGNPDLNITNPRVEEFLNRIRARYNNYNNEENGVNAFQVHKAFDKVNTEALFDFMKPSLSNNVNNTMNMNKSDFVEYIRSTLEEFIELIPKNNSRRAAAETDIDNIFTNVLNNIAYKEEYKKIISYCLEYVAGQPDEFKIGYVSNFTYDCAHAYNNANGNASAEISCAKGMIERFVFSLVPAAILFVDTPDFKEKSYDTLISIIENKPKDLRALIDDFSKDCYEEASNSEEDFKKCLKRKLQEKLGNSYNETVVSKELNEYVPTFGLFGGGKKRRVMKTRKHRARKMTRLRKTIHKSIGSKRSVIKRRRTKRRYVKK